MSTTRIVYSINGAAPRTIKVPTVSEARARRYNPARFGRLDQMVMDLGELQGAEKYILECFSHRPGTRIELHDGGGCLRSWTGR